MSRTTPDESPDADSTSTIIIQVPAGITRDLAVGYVARCRGGLLSLSTALDRGDFEAVRVYGHRMKGSGGAYGIPRITEIGAAIEQAAKAKDLTELQNVASTLDAYLRRLAVASESELA